MEEVAVNRSRPPPSLPGNRIVLMDKMKTWKHGSLLSFVWVSRDSKSSDRGKLGSSNKTENMALCFVIQVPKAEWLICCCPTDVITLKFPVLYLFPPTNYSLLNAKAVVSTSDVRCDACDSLLETFVLLLQDPEVSGGYAVLNGTIGQRVTLCVIAVFNAKQRVLQQSKKLELNLKSLSSPTELSIICLHHIVRALLVHVILIEQFILKMQASLLSLEFPVVKWEV